MIFLARLDFLLRFFLFVFKATQVHIQRLHLLSYLKIAQLNYLETKIAQSRHFCFTLPHLSLSLELQLLSWNGFGWSHATILVTCVSSGCSLYGTYLASPPCNRTILEQKSWYFQALWESLPSTFLIDYLIFMHIFMHFFLAYRARIRGLQHVGANYKANVPNSTWKSTKNWCYERGRKTCSSKFLARKLP